jgi:hypothetical protein
MHSKMPVYGDVRMQGLERMRYPFDFFSCQHKLRELFLYSCDPSAASQSWTNGLYNLCFDTPTGASSLNFGSILPLGSDSVCLGVIDREGKRHFGWKRRGRAAEQLRPSREY